MTQLLGLEAMRSQSEPLAGLIESFLRDRHDLKPKSKQVYRTTLNDFDHSLGPLGGRIEDLNAKNLSALIRVKLDAGHRHAARNLAVVVKLMSSWATEAGIFESNPCIGVKAPKVTDEGRKPYTADEIETIIAVSHEGRYGARDSAIMLLMCSTGIRLNEARELNIADVDLNRCRITVRAETSKSAKTRTVRMHELAAAAIDSYVKDWRGLYRDPHLFLGAAGKPFTTNGFGHVFQRLAERLERDHGIKGFMAHRWRTTWASNYRPNGAGDLYDLQNEGGWKAGSLEMIRKHYDKSEGIEHLVNKPHPMGNILTMPVRRRRKATA